MKRFVLNRITPQQKIVGVNNRLGNTNIKKQQGSTVSLYDTLPLDGQTYFEFFKSAKNRDFPFTNFTDGKLQPGESFVMERSYLSVITTTAEGIPTSVRELSLTTDGPIAAGEFHFRIDNDRVIKPLPVLSWFDNFNKSSEFTGDQVYEFDTQIVIPPLIQIAGNLQVNDYDPLDYPNGFLRLTIEGPGGIFAPKANF